MDAGNKKIKTHYKNKDVDAVKHLLRLIGEDPEREGLQETPLRFLKAMARGAIARSPRTC
jgi:GTP cyclohydrolase I